jgi:hypothetical protein
MKGMGKTYTLNLIDDYLQTFTNDEDKFQTLKISNNNNKANFTHLISIKLSFKVSGNIVETSFDLLIFLVEQFEQLIQSRFKNQDFRLFYQAVEENTTHNEKNS